MATPKETLLLNVIMQELKKRGHEIILSTRKYAETNDLINYLGMHSGGLSLCVTGKDT